MRRLCCAILVTLAVGLVPVAPAQASSAGTHFTRTSVVNQVDYSTLTNYPSGSGSIYYTPPGGSYARLVVYYSATLVSDWAYYPIIGIQCDGMTISGSARAYWSGAVPWNANAIQIQQQLSVTGLSGTLSVPWGGSLGLNTGSYTADSGQIANVWQWTSTYGSLHFGGLLYGFHESVSAHFWFPGADHQIWASSSDIGL